MRSRSSLWKLILVAAVLGFIVNSCSKDNSASVITAKLNFVFKFDSTQARLNNVGMAAAIPAGHSGQSPRFNSMSAHYVELAPTALTALGTGAVLYHAPEVTTGGSNAIDFSQSVKAQANEVWLSVPFSSIAPGSYQWLRVSLAYQNYNITAYANSVPVNATVASFIGFRTYIQSYKVKDSTVVVNANRDQGYWAVEASITGLGGTVQSGQAPPGATTVPNPIFATSPIPAGSCVVTAAFASPLVITGTETMSKTIVVAVSTNKSFEWIDGNGNGLYEPLLGEQVVDMGVRGMIPTIR